MVESCDFYARLLLDRIHYNELPRRPREIAQRLNIIVRDAEASGGFDGYLLKVEETFGIMINASIKNENRKNFTIAHELGHYEIPHHKGKEFKCLGSTIGVMLGNDFEIEANDFAAELLMPASLVEEEISNAPTGMGVIKLIASKCETSLTSSALRYIKFSPAFAVLVLSERGKIKFSIFSEQMRDNFGRSILPHLQKGISINRASLAYDLFNPDLNATPDTEVQDIVDLSAWLPTLDYSRFDCHEASLKLASLNQVISLIWLSQKSTYSDDFCL